MAQAALYGSAPANFITSGCRGQVQWATGSKEEWEHWKTTIAEEHVISVYDARSGPAWSLAQNGFELVRLPSKVTNFDDEAAVKGALYQEYSELLKSLTGCRETIALTHLRRNGKPGDPRGGVYSHDVHSDINPFYEASDISAMGKKMRARLAGKHFALFNLWRSIDLDGDIEMYPLAVCDPATVADDDMVHFELHPDVHQMPKRKDFIYRLAHNPAQRFYVFPRMSSGDVLVFSQYDTRYAEPHLRQAFHASVPIDDPSSQTTPRSRLSIEVRFLAIFGDDTEASSRLATFHAQSPAAKLEAHLKQAKL